MAPTPALPPAHIPPRLSLLARIARMRFWSVSAAIHAILILLIGSKVFIEARKAEPDFAASADIGSMDEPLPVALEPKVSLPSATNVIAQPAAPAAPSSSQLNAIVAHRPTAGPSLPAEFVPPAPKPSMGDVFNKLPDFPRAGPKLDREHARQIAIFTKDWATNPMGGLGTPVQAREFKFTAYVAQYSGGDWDSTVHLKEGLITKGSLPNLLYMMSKLSREKVVGQPQVRPLNLASSDLINKKPPFVFFTGHQDFVLSEEEVKNLQTYIRLGGCIWGDSSLAGQRSRFDIAFRREMKRVITEQHKQWQALPEGHPIFARNYFPEVKAQPAGLNYYREPVYTLEGVAGEIGVIYTANNYGDMYQFGLDENGAMDLSRDERREMVATNERMWHRRNLYFRNVEPKSLMQSYKFGMNVVIHLMTRFEEKLRAAGVDSSM